MPSIPSTSDDVREKNKKVMLRHINMANHLLNQLNIILNQLNNLERPLSDKSKKEGETYLTQARKIQSETSEIIKSSIQFVDDYSKKMTEEDSSDPKLIKAKKKIPLDLTTLMKKESEVLRSYQNFTETLQKSGYSISTLSSSRAPGLASISSSSSAPPLSPPPPSLSSSSSSPSTPEWASPAIIEKVRIELTKQKRTTTVTELKNAFETYGRTQAGSAERIKCEEILKSIVNMPGWGHVPLDKRDELVYISREEFERRTSEVLERLKSKKLEGTEEITGPIIESYFSIWEKMVAPPGTQPGEPLRIDAKSLILPLFCIDGPPGVGKTTIVNAIAYALDMPSEYVRMQNTDAGTVIGYTRQYGTPKPSLTTVARTKHGRSSAVILFDELDKASLGTHNAIAGITESGEPEVRDEYLETNVPKGFNLMIAATNNFNKLPSHLISRFGHNKLYFWGYSDDAKIKILKNMAMRAVGEQHHKIKFLSTGGDKDPKAYTIESVSDKRERSIDSQCFIKPEGSEEQLDAIAYIVENYITEPGVREAESLLKKVIEKASAEFSLNLRLKADNERKSGKTVNWTQLEASIPPVKINKDIIHKALKFPDPQVKIIKDLNKEITEQKKKLSALTDYLANIDESTKYQRETLLQQLYECNREKDTLISLEKQIISALKKRLKNANNDEVISKNIKEQIEYHEENILSIKKESEDLNQHMQNLLGTPIKDLPPDKQLHGNNTPPPSPPSPILSFSTETPNPRKKLTIRTQGADIGTKLSVGPGGPLFFQHRVGEQIRQTTKIVVASATTITPEVFKAITDSLHQDIHTIQTSLRGSRTLSEDQKSFDGLEVRSVEGNDCKIVRHVPWGSDPALEPESVITLTHKGKNLEIISDEEIPSDDALYAMVLAAKTAAEKLGKKRFTIENCEQDPRTAFKLYLIGKSMGMEPAFKDLPHLRGATLKGITEDSFSTVRLQTDLGEKTVVEIYEEVRSGKLKGSALKNYIASLEQIESSSFELGSPPGTPKNQNSSGSR